jgi:hypothetical protein
VKIARVFVCALRFQNPWHPCRRWQEEIGDKMAGGVLSQIQKKHRLDMRGNTCSAVKLTAPQ